MADILTPALGESVAEATIAKWTKKVGDPVKRDELLVELETDKVSLEVVSPADGTLGEIAFAEGDTVTPGAILGKVTEGAAAPTGAVELLLKPKGSTKGKRVKKTVVLAEGDRPVVRVRLPKVRKGKYLLLVRYAGDDLVEKARTVRKTLRVKAR